MGQTGKGCYCHRLVPSGQMFSYLRRVVAAKNGGDHRGRLQGGDHGGRLQIRKHRTARYIADARLQFTPSVISGPGTANNIVFLAEDGGAYLPCGGKRAGGRAGGGESQDPHHRVEECGKHVVCSLTR